MEGGQIRAILWKHVTTHHTTGSIDYDREEHQQRFAASPLM